MKAATAIGIALAIGLHPRRRASWRALSPPALINIPAR